MFTKKRIHYRQIPKGQAGCRPNLTIEMDLIVIRILQASSLLSIKSFLDLHAPSIQVGGAKTTDEAASNR